ncbi:MAG TPA: prepilin peptidase [Gemmataceae bacterium]|jgi:leader peptidase (prepilin peptidase)/N-methyltransferase|nr:prepilin peptidase [Gemmataceae bacterium]
MIFDRLLDPDMPAPLVWFVLFWLFAAGACIGSFMNVVIYRLPAGLSLLHPPSRCPACETPIRATDNVPIFGWMRLRGRCRQCRASISARYPAVELLVAILFVGLAWAELLSPVEDGQTLAESWGVYAYHLFLLCSLICAAFIEFDGHALPARLMVPALIVGLGAPLLWPHLRPLAAGDGNAVADGLTGFAAGTILGLATWPASFVRSAQRTILRDFTVTLACVGAFLGWQATSGVAVIAAALRLLVALGSRVPAIGRIGCVGCVSLTALVWIMAWKATAQRLPWMGGGVGPTTWLGTVAGVLVLSLATRMVLKGERRPAVP